MYFRLLAIIVIVLLASNIAEAQSPGTSQKSSTSSKLKQKKPQIDKILKKEKKPKDTNKPIKSPPVKTKLSTGINSKTAPIAQKNITNQNLSASIPAPAKYIINMEDETELLKIIDLASNQKWDDAESIATRCKDPNYAKSIVRILKIYYSPQDIPLKDISDFFRLHKWISHEPFAPKIERSIAYDNAPGSIIEWFNGREPQTNSGKFSLLHASITVGSASLKDENVKHSLRYLWRNTEFDLGTEEYYLKKYKDFLTVDDLLSKIEFLTWNKSYTYADQLLSILPQQYKTLPKTRLELARSKLSLDRTLKGLDSKYTKDDFIQYNIINGLLNNDKDDAALKKLLNFTPKSGFDKWWKIKNMAIRNALRDKQYVEAYKLTENHNLDYGQDLAEAEWLGGWIALRFLSDPELALPRFQSLFQNTKLSSSKSKGAYWLARSYEALGDTANANEWYSKASDYKGTFYGHLAIASIHGDAKHDYFEHPGFSEKQANYEHKELAKKLTYFSYLLHKSEVRVLANSLIATLADLDIDRNDIEMSALYFVNRKYHPFAVEIAKSTSNKGAPLIKHGYPKHVDVSGNNLPKGLYLGIIRQESLFDPNAVSSAGARGLMQLMPATASKVAKNLGHSKLSFDPESNVSHGVAYYDTLYQQYKSIPIALAAYNAGPGNANKWLSRYGDPRGSGDAYAMIDWIESIPFNETRNYVKKVMENYVVYDSILDHNHAPSAMISYLE